MEFTVRTEQIRLEAHSTPEPERRGAERARVEGTLRRISPPPRGWMTGRQGGKSWCLSATKRYGDAIIAALTLLALSPLGLLISILIKVDSRGPIFFAQERTGYRGRRFKMWKLRTMYADAEERKEKLLALNRHGEDAIDFKVVDDPRISRVGKWLRRFSLDEVPNMFAVIKGDMRLVGPRPTSFDIDLYNEEHLVRLAVPPGLTGLWQISGRSELNFDERVRLDAEYIRRQSPWLDLKILLWTPIRVISGLGAC